MSAASTRRWNEQRARSQDASKFALGRHGAGEVWFAVRDASGADRASRAMIAEDVRGPLVTALVGGAQGSGR